MVCHNLCVLALGTSLASAVSQNQVNYERDCQSVADFGWPRFQSGEELLASSWSSYFLDVYGEIPSKYPVCIYDLQVLDENAFRKANITGHEVVTATDVKEGDLFPILDGRTMLTAQMLGIYHESWKALPDHAWAEVTHTAFPTEAEGFWAWRTRGSGIWYNIGKTKVFRTPANPLLVHREAIAFLSANCSRNIKAWPQQESDIFGFCAREKGYDSIQFEPRVGQKPTGTFSGLTGLFEMVLVNMDGKHECGVEDASRTPLREGWQASRRCDCENHEIAASCGLIPRGPFPLSIAGTSPRLCKLQEGPPFWNRWKACDSSTCRPTQCRMGRRPVQTMPVAIAGEAARDAVVVL